MCGPANIDTNAHPINKQTRGSEGCSEVSGIRCDPLALCCRDRAVSILTCKQTGNNGIKSNLKGPISPRMFSRRRHDPRWCSESVVLLRTHSVLDNEAALNCRQMELRGRFGARSPFQTQNNLPSPSLFKINDNFVHVGRCHNKKLLGCLSGLIICRLKCYVGFVRCRCRLLCYRNHTPLRAAIAGMFEIWNTKNRHHGFSFISPPTFKQR